MSKPLIIYHAGCQDGFGGAFAAWKKFGDGAEYRAAFFQGTPPVDIAGRQVYLIDVTFSPDQMQEMAKTAASLTVIDHHESSEAAVAALPGTHIFSLEHSGCFLAWEHFHPGTPVPTLLRYVEEGDTWRRTLPDSIAIQRYIYIQPMEFALWDRLMAECEDPKTLAQHRDKGMAYDEYRQILLDILAEQAEEVEFQGYRILAVNAPPQFRSDLGSLLAKRKGPFSLVWRYFDGALRCSLRGDGTVDVAKIAEQFPGGGGHPNAAGFTVEGPLKLPFTFVR